MYFRLKSSVTLTQKRESMKRGVIPDNVHGEYEN